MTTNIQQKQFKVTLTGFKPIMFDRYLGDNHAKVEDAEKLYRLKNGDLYIPAVNIQSFLCAMNTRSAARVIYDKRQYKDKSNALLSFVNIEPAQIPILRNGKPVTFTGTFDHDSESGPSGIWIEKHIARLKDGIPNPKSRPVVGNPWSIAFTLTLVETSGFDVNIKPDEIKKLFSQGGIVLGLGTYRGVYGKFTVQWEEI